MPTTDERKRFGGRLREYRQAQDLTLDDLAEKLADAGEEFSAANIGAWERGQYSPRKRSTVTALETVLGARGELAPLLGMLDPTLSLASGADLEELQRLDPDGYEDVVALIQSRLRRARGKG